MSHDQPPQQAPPAKSAATNPRYVTTFAVVAAATMTLLALLGTAITLADATWARRYWLFLVPVYGLLCILTAWWHRGTFSETVGRQLLHWICVALAIVMDFAYLQGSGQQTATGTGLSSLLILALGCLLAGVHLDWLFALVGALLLVIVIIVAAAQEYLMLVFLAGAIAIVAILFAPRLMRKWAA